MLRDLKRRQQAARRQDEPPRWRLYETRAGNVPKELAEMFSGIKTAVQVKQRPKVPVLTAEENAVLKASLDFIDRHGFRRLQDVVAPSGDKPPRVETIKRARGPLWELKVKSQVHNPRFIFVNCGGTVVFLDAFKKKTQQLLRKDVEASDNRYVDLKDRGECS